MNTINDVATNFELAMAFKFADFNAKNKAKAFFNSLTSKDFASGVKAFVNAVDSHAHKSLTFQMVGESVLNGTASDVEEAKAVATAGFMFTNELASFVDAYSVVKESVQETKDGKAYIKKIANYVVNGTVLEQFLTVKAGQSNHGLTAQPPSDYDFDGFNAEGESLFLKGNHHKPAAISVKAANIQQKKSISVDDAEKVAAALFAINDKFDVVIAKAKKKAGVKAKKLQSKNA